MKKLKILLPIIILSFLAYLYISPYLVLNTIKEAAQVGDDQKISAYIDYPSVRQSVKQTINAKMTEKAKQKAGKIGAFGALLASSLVDDVVDTYVTPQSMQMLFKSGEILKKPENNQTKSQTPEDIEYTTGYTSLNRFHLDINKHGSPHKVTIIMHRDGLSWKIKQLALPL